MTEIKLNPKQQEAVAHLNGPMVVLSVAGSGKTMVLTERIIHLIEGQNLDPSGILAITFAKKAVMEIEARLAQRLNGNGNKATVSTFHSLGYRMLRETGYPTGGFRVIQNLDQLRLFQQAMRRAEAHGDPASLLTKLSLAKNDLMRLSDLEKSGSPEEKSLAKVFHAYEHLKRRKRLVDYDDLLYLPHRLLTEDEGLLRFYQDQFQYILVDEFQDSSKIMVELVRLLSKTHQNVWLAGDDDQSIHGFRGARVDIFVSLDRQFKGDLKTITMDQNYRSTKNILKVANKLIAHNKKRVKKEAITDNDNGEEVKLLELANEWSEAEFIADQIGRLKEYKVKYGEMAILARVYRIMPLIEAALITERIPYVSREGFFFNRLEVKTVIGVMKFLLTQEAPSGLDEKLMEHVIKDLKAGSEEINFKDAYDLAACYLMMKMGPRYGEEDELSLTRFYLDALEKLVIQHEDLPSFLKSVEQAQTIHGKFKNDAVNLLTIHQAKGLEFRYVFVPAVNEGILPHVNSMDQLVTLEEERRLMYVAMTRARERLFITYRRRQMDQLMTLPSRFIKELSR